MTQLEAACRITADLMLYRSTTGANGAPMCPKSRNERHHSCKGAQMFYCSRGELWSTTSLSPCHGIKEGIYAQALSASLWQQNGVCSRDLLGISLINEGSKAKVWTKGGLGGGGGGSGPEIFSAVGDNSFIYWERQWHRGVLTYLKTLRVWKVERVSNHPRG